ncbi:MAG: polyprenyl synthetase family protein [Candidatus Moranbacteria bacterium CG10_big_fil_rev_8_21_14_0_10_35_21]|nr:MAG: polyprenyl synthetase family protein [Candidatus Moranbacteria bacterium CG10_big_fil_rev_8_21_14_0_10_35_21]PJA88969.1 MAG: polyprenyl synthetase family protein [Candidatus Moranbacteria bacterium CG_4_9_14_3_um_filter_36_9]
MIYHQRDIIETMDVKKELADFKKKIDKEIEDYFDATIKEVAKIDLITTDSLRYVKKIILAGGKRLRPAFMFYGYLAAGGKEKEKILKTAVSIELIHMFLLIHDDIIDRDGKRHGMETVNLHYEKIGKKLFPKNSVDHFGNSMAIIIGDMVGALGNQIIFNSSFDSKIILKALYKLQNIVSLTVVGQTKDIYIEYRQKASEEEILKMYEYKTARYTVEGPLHLGAILGGTDENFLKNLSLFAVPIGIAFQIQDDILGIFGSEKKIGKEVGSDIKGGKETLLVEKAKEKGTPAQKKILEALLGSKNIKSADIEKFRSIILETGALEYAQKLSRDLIAQGKDSLEKMEFNSEAKEFLLGLADYMAEREF